MKLFKVLRLHVHVHERVVAALAAAACVMAMTPVALAQPAALRPSTALLLHEPGQVPSAPLLSANLPGLDRVGATIGHRAGRPMVVNFWARWCVPCRIEIPELVALRQRDEGVDVIGIAIEDDAGAVRDFARAYEINYPLRASREAGIELMRTLGNTAAGLPFSVVLDRQGAVAATRMGALTREQLDQALRHARR
jgi:thiol-disulfide isomerase/thioredoxin